MPLRLEPPILSWSALAGSLLPTTKTTVYNFYHALEKLMGNVGERSPQLVPGVPASPPPSLWWVGGPQLFDASGAEGTQSGELAVDCAACPWLDINLSEDWMNIPPEKWHLFTLFLVLNACFRLKQCLISSELKDPRLVTGQHMWAYLSCSGLAALNYVNTKFSRSYAMTGVGMSVYVMHKFCYLRFANMDYILGSILHHKDSRLWKLISYDIVSPKLLPLVQLNVILYLYKFVIPKLHIHADTILCQILFSLNLTLGSAQTDANIGRVAASMGDMGPGGRHRTLYFQWSAWN
ncbi:hypothetical protein C8R46DRAFT_1169562 [Mycena filopes]|nr:hypothetical protein C8R46DRAFT_1169562 [Mycena filopes]